MPEISQHPNGRWLVSRSGHQVNDGLNENNNTEQYPPKVNQMTYGIHVFSLGRATLNIEPWVRAARGKTTGLSHEDKHLMGFS